MLMNTICSKKKGSWFQQWMASVTLCTPIYHVTAAAPDLRLVL